MVPPSEVLHNMTSLGRNVKKVARAAGKGKRLKDIRIKEKG
jgi:hypothetical protein